MKPNRVGFVGAGNIAEALIRGFITSGYLDPGQIVISDPNRERADRVNQSLGTLIAETNPDNASQCDILFLTVKPQHVATVCDEIRDKLKRGCFVISVAAGTSLGSVKGALGGYERVCRIMPNLAAAVRRATIGLYSEQSPDSDDLAPVFALLSRVGRVFGIEDEHLMAVVTALSGSAPAYYVMMADALIKYGVSQGMDEELARNMILTTMESSSAWASSSATPLEKMWKKVVTPGGTTEAGTSYYDEEGFIDIFVEGLARATKRARELGDE
jgi:pyrroline-5-carboxylate reductase